MITIITRRECAYCTYVKDLLKQEGVDYNEQIIDETIDREHVLKKYPGRKQLPIVIDSAGLSSTNPRLGYLQKFLYESVTNDN